MLAPTHGVFGLFLTLILLAIFGVQEGLHWAILAVALFGSIAPDIDLKKSLIGRLFWFISKPIERHFGHRTVTHSLIGWGLASLLFGLCAASAFFLLDHFHYTPAIANFFKIPESQAVHHLLRIIVAFSIGYASHILLDMFNPRGVQLFWPNDSRDVIPGNVKFRPNAGSKAEAIVFVAFSFLLILALPISNYGLMTSLRWLLATPEAAIEEFKNSNFRTYVEFEGMFQSTKEKISGTAEILDSQNKRLIVIFPTHHTLQRTAGASAPENLNASLSQRQILTLSDELTSDVITTKVRAIKTTEKIQTKKITFEDQNSDDLLATLNDTDLVSGTVTLPEGLKLTIPPTNKGAFKAISQSGTTLTLQFATKAQLQALKLTQATQKHQKSLTDQRRRLEQKRDQLTDKLYTLAHPQTDLTPLGQQLLNNPKSESRANLAIDRLHTQIEEIDRQLQDTKDHMDSSRLLLSGEVFVRSF
jgi:inner membrane protein